MTVDQADTRPARAGVSSGIPEALHIGSNDRPYADDFGAPGVRLQLMQADVEGGTFVVRIRFAPGVQLPPHKHTGVVFAYTLAWEWSYLEYPTAPPNRAGSYLYEPPGSTHTLKGADDAGEETDVIFVVTGAMLVMQGGAVVAVLDAESHMRDWGATLRAQGKSVPAVIRGGRIGYSAPE